MTKEIKPTISKSKARKAKRTREKFAQSTPTLKVDYSYPDRNRGKKVHYGATAPLPGDSSVESTESDAATGAAGAENDQPS